jgi:hypothetical protein
MIEHFFLDATARCVRSRRPRPASSRRGDEIRHGEEDFRRPHHEPSGKTSDMFNIIYLKRILN